MTSSLQNKDIFKDKRTCQQNFEINIYTINQSYYTLYRKYEIHIFVRVLMIA